MLSVISPVFNSSSCLEKLVKKIVLSSKKISKKIEIILIDDGSEDDSWSKIVDLKKKYKFIKGIKLNKNYGQHQAIYIGIKHSSQKIVIIMDCDLQDDPSFIPEMYQLYKNEKKPVIIKHSYEDYTFKSRLISNIFWFTLSIISLRNFSPYLGNFLLIDNRIKKNYLTLNEIGYLYGDLVFKNNNFNFIKKKRPLGIRRKTSYNFSKLIKLGLRLIIKYNLFSKLLNRENFVKRKKIYIKKII